MVFVIYFAVHPKYKQTEQTDRWRRDGDSDSKYNKMSVAGTLGPFTLWTEGIILYCQGLLRFGGDINCPLSFFLWTVSI